MKKEQMLTFVTELEKNNNLCINMKSGSEQQIYEMLVQCQDTAICLGNALEKKGEKGELLMHMLEDYCEYVYQLSQNLKDENFCRKIIKKIRQLLNNVKNGITYEVPNDKKEIVFFPYKASMWDSLESIWQEAIKDDDFDVYVVPIPYYAKNPDGSIKEWHYEGNLYPEYVPVTPWEDYNLSERKPEVVFFHNPYDNYNLVTSVHPMYYSSELKKYTNQLIYIPYFVVTKDISENFVIIPAVFNADYVVVQSEEIKEQYHKVYVDYLVNQITKNNAEINRQTLKQLSKSASEKFLAFGSPKIDKVHMVNTVGAYMPEEWKKLIVDSEGNRKKIILYNTTISSLLENRECYIEKIQLTLREFKDDRDVVLWWRPHPLLQCTLDSMIPDFAARYKRIVEQYKSESWGIYDDTEDLNRAIYFSDAYYGDPSSVVALYRETGKPILYQRMNKRNVFGLDMGMVGKDFLLCPMIHLNAVAKIDISTGIMEIFLLDSEQTIFDNGLYKLSELQDDLAILIPCHGKQYLLWNIEKGICDEIPLDNPVDINYVSAIRQNNQLYFVPYGYPAIGKYNLDTHEINYLKLPQDCKYPFARSGVAVNNSLIFVHYDTSKSYKYDLGSGEVGELDKFGNCNSICSDGHICWLGRNDSVIIQWDIETDEVQELKLPDGYENSGIYPLWNSFYTNGYAIFESFQANMVLRVNTETGIVTKLNMPIEECEIHFNKDDRCYCIAYDEEYAYFFSQRKFAIIKINIDENEYEIIKVRVSLEDLNRFEKAKVQYPFGKYEKYALGDFPSEDKYSLQYLKNQIPYNFNVDRNNDNTSGQKIVRFIKRKMN